MYSLWAQNGHDAESSQNNLLNSLFGGLNVGGAAQNGFHHQGTSGEQKTPVGAIGSGRARNQPSQPRPGVSNNANGPTMMQNGFGERTFPSAVGSNSHAANHQNRVEDKADAALAAHGLDALFTRPPPSASGQHQAQFSSAGPRATSGQGPLSSSSLGASGGIWNMPLNPGSSKNGLGDVDRREAIDRGNGGTNVNQVSSLIHSIDLIP
jgi:hypothetical protein